MPTFERVDGDTVVERRHVPYRSRDLATLEQSPTWRKVAEGYAPAADDRPRPTVEEQRAGAATAARTKANNGGANSGGGGG